MDDFLVFWVYENIIGSYLYFSCESKALFWYLLGTNFQLCSPESHNFISLLTLTILLNPENPVSCYSFCHFVGCFFTSVPQGRALKSWFYWAYFLVLSVKFWTYEETQTQVLDSITYFLLYWLLINLQYLSHSLAIGLSGHHLLIVLAYCLTFEAIESLSHHLVEYSSYYLSTPKIPSFPSFYWYLSYPPFPSSVKYSFDSSLQNTHCRNYSATS